jgi:diguanylate cyclase (GGDEF)-like protein
MAHNIENQIPFCVVLFDLNRFKLINDTFGHQAGDDLLRQFAEKLKQKSRATDMIGRWGGDEFLSILSGNIDQVKFHAQRLQREVCTRYMLHGADGFYSTLDIEAAAGVAQWQPEESQRQVVTRADAEMYRDKGRMNETSSGESQAAVGANELSRPGKA